MVEFRVLGSVEVYLDGRPIDVGPARQRCVLAVLLVEANTAVSTDQLIDRVWADHPPQRVRSSLHSYLTRLRQALAEAPVSITQRSGNYVLTVDEQTVDLHRFRRLITNARTADDEHALTLLEHALGLWRGEPFAGLDTPWLATIRATLQQEQSAATLDHVDLALRCGRHTALLPVLSTLARENPLDERVAGQLMLALYRSGRQADALNHYQLTRRRLADELGADPGSPLQQLHHHILTADPALAEPGSTTASGPQQLSGARRGRSELPGDVADFTGREQEMTRLLAALPEQGDDPAAAARAAVIEAIDGMAGVGKTALAVHAAHHLVERYPDAQLFIDLHGHTTGHDATDPMTALDTLLRAVGVPGEQIPHDLQARAARWRAELTDRKALVVLDNAANAAQVRPLLPGTAGCLTLITSRRRLVDLEAARVLSLDVLPRPDAIALFTRILDDDRATAEPSTVEEVVALCGDLPLAIRIAAARLRTRPTWTISYLAERLRNQNRRLGELAAGDRSVAAAFALSYHHLTGEQQHMFRLLGLHPGPDFDIAAAAALANTDMDTAERVLEDLVDVHLLQQPAPGRYRFHDLLRHHAHQTAHDTDPHADQEAALRRLVDYYLHTAFTAEKLLSPHREPIQLGDPAGGCHPHPLADETAALTWLDAEHPNLLATHHLAAKQGWHPPLWQLAWALDTFHYRRGHLHDELAVWRIGLVAAQQLGDPVAQTRAHRRLGRASTRMGQHAEAVWHLQQALTLADHTGDLPPQADTHHVLGWAWDQQGDIQRALEHATHALHLYRTLGHPAGEADALNAVGWYQARLGHHTQARARCESALVLARRHHNREGEAATLDSLGYIAHHTGQHTQALDYYQQTLTLRRDLGNTNEQANTLDHLAQTHHTLGQHKQARAAWHQALQLYQAQHHTIAADRIHQQLAALDQPSA